MTKIPVYSIDRDVPVPKDAKKPSIRQLVPIERLQPGESILFPLKYRSTVATIASRLGTVGMSYTIKKVDDKNARIWRVA